MNTRKGLIYLGIFLIVFMASGCQPVESEGMGKYLGMETDAKAFKELMSEYKIIKFKGKGPHYTTLGNELKFFTDRNEKIIDIVINVHKEDGYMPFKGKLPFGVKKESTEREIIKLLGSAKILGGVDGIRRYVSFRKNNRQYSFIFSEGSLYCVSMHLVYEKQDSPIDKSELKLDINAEHTFDVPVR